MIVEVFREALRKATRQLGKSRAPVFVIATAPGPEGQAALTWAMENAGNEDLMFMALGILTLVERSAAEGEIDCEGCADICDALPRRHGRPQWRCCARREALALTPSEPLAYAWGFARLALGVAAGLLAWAALFFAVGALL